MSSASSKPAFVYTVHRLPPTSPDFKTLAERFAALRLRALQTSQHSFSSTYALESTFTPDQWQTRLSRTGVHTFVAIAHPPNTAIEDQTIKNGEWVGKVTLIGPTSKDAYELKESGGPVPGDDAVETKWQMTALYTEPEHRGKGLGKEIIKEALDYARSGGETAQGGSEVANGAREEAPPQKPKQTRVRIMIHPDNAVVARMYESLGFVDAGRCTLSEGYVCNGDGHLLPEGGGDPGKFRTRRGLVMELLKEAK